LSADADITLKEQFFALPAEKAVYPHFPFDVVKITGNESIDFFQRISTNDFQRFTEGNIQKTLFITEKGRVIDAAWIIHRGDHQLLLCSNGMGAEVISWLNKFIIMEDIILDDVTSGHAVDIYFVNDGTTDYFGLPANIVVNEEVQSGYRLISNKEFEYFRIFNGIPKTNHELVRDFNPLELNLWSFISFTKGCYIGQEIIARLDTYQKIQRVLCRIKLSSHIAENSSLVDDLGNEIGKITSVFPSNDAETVGLAVVKIKNLEATKIFTVKDTSLEVNVEHVFAKDLYGRN